MEVVGRIETVWGDEFLSLTSSPTIKHLLLNGSSFLITIHLRLDNNWTQRMKSTVHDHNKEHLANIPVSMWFWSRSLALSPWDDARKPWDSRWNHESYKVLRIYAYTGIHTGELKVVETGWNIVGTVVYIHPMNSQHGKPVKLTSINIPLISTHQCIHALDSGCH